jgi:taurine transport system permease protein
VFVILPGALPEILTGLRIGLGVGWSTLVAAELIAATRVRFYGAVGGRVPGD